MYPLPLEIGGFFDATTTVPRKEKNAIENYDNSFVIFNYGQGYDAYGGTQHSSIYVEMPIAWKRK